VLAIQGRLLSSKCQDSAVGCKIAFSVIAFTVLSNDREMVLYVCVLLYASLLSFRFSSEEHMLRVANMPHRSAECFMSGVNF